MDRGRLIILRAALQKIIRKRGILNPRESEQFNADTQDLADILDFLIDMENNREFWKDRATH